METIAGINYSKPTVTLLQETGIGTAEYAARTCYDSFGASEHAFLQDMDVLNDPSVVTADNIDSLNNITHSDLLDKLAWTHFHHSILEHANLTFLIKGTSRGVLQEHARHRIQAISVRSTRYTMSSVINAFVASTKSETPRAFFTELVLLMDMFVTTDDTYNRILIDEIYSKLYFQYKAIPNDFMSLAVAKSSLDFVATITDAQTLFDTLETGKAKRNVADPFKMIVSDAWKVDMVVTFNLRSLKNYFELRDSGAAYFQIRWLAQAMKEATPSKYLDLVVKK